VSSAAPKSSRSAEQRFQHYLDQLADVLGHADWREPLRLYTTGLLLPGERKSVEPMAARLDPRHVRSRHQSLHHLVADADWDDTAVLAAVRDYALPALQQQGPIQAWIVDDTGLPKKGTHSVGVAHQYCGQLGKQANCQVAVSLSIANHTASLPIAYRLYLPQDWAQAAERRRKTGIPDESVFQTKAVMARGQIRQALHEGVPPGVVVADAAYGNDTSFRDELTALGLRYAVAIQANTTVWPKGTEPLPSPAYKGTGRPPKLLRRDEQHQPVSAEQMALGLSASAWRTVTWREGTAGLLRSRFARVRVRAAHRDYWRGTLRAEEWLVLEWPEGEPRPTKYWLSTLARNISLRKLVEAAKLRWRVERDYQELKQELGLGHFEGRGWRGFHHHATLSMAAYGFLVAERAAFPPSGGHTRPHLKVPRLPRSFRPRGAARPDRTASSALDCEHACPPDRRAARTVVALPLLSSALHAATTLNRSPVL
jgi:SRSO17 transposase